MLSLIYNMPAPCSLADNNAEHVLKTSCVLNLVLMAVAVIPTDYSRGTISLHEQHYAKYSTRIGL